MRFEPGEAAIQSCSVVVGKVVKEVTMSCETSQCKKIRALVSLLFAQLYPERNEPLCTVLDLGDSPAAVQVNLSGQENEVRSLTLVCLPSQDTLPSEVREIVSDFAKNPTTRRYVFQ